MAGIVGSQHKEQSTTSNSEATTSRVEPGGATRAMTRPSGIFTLTGFSFMCTWHFLMLFSAVFTYDPSGPMGRSFYIQLALYLSLAGTYFVLAHLSDAFMERAYSRRRGHINPLNLAFTIFASLISLCVFIVPDRAPLLQVLLYSCLGISGALLIFPWLAQQRQGRGGEDDYRNLAFNMGIGATLALFISFLSIPLVNIAICLLPILSNMTLLFQGPSSEEIEAAEAARREEDERRRQLAQEGDGAPSDTVRLSAGELIASNMFVIVYGFAFGFCQGVFADSGTITFILNDGWPILGAALSAVVIIVYPMKYLKTYGIYAFQRTSLVLFYGGIFLSAFFRTPGTGISATAQVTGLYIAQIITLTGFNVFEFGFMVFSYLWASGIKTDFNRYSGFNRFCLYLGTAGGLALGFLMFSIFGGNGGGYYLLCLGLVVVLLGTATLPFFDVLIPYQWMADTRANPPLPIAYATEAEPRPLETGPTMEEWEANVKRIAQEHELSKRETEVFMYLARGHNAAYVKQELWISIHTAKTHIANVYHKLGVHSLQEVLEIVDYKHMPPEEDEKRTSPAGHEPLKDED